MSSVRGISAPEQTRWLRPGQARRRPGNENGNEEGECWGAFRWCSIQLLLPTGASPTESDGVGHFVRNSLLPVLLEARFRRVYLGGAHN